MIPYLAPFFFLTTLAYLEHFNQFNSVLRNKIFYTILILTFIIFIGFRFQVGCDWETYEYNFNKLVLIDFSEMFEDPRELVDIFYSLVVKSLSYFFDYHIYLIALSLLGYLGIFFYFKKKNV